MKFGELIKVLKKRFDSNFFFIDYNNLKSNIDDNIFENLSENIKKFSKCYDKKIKYLTDDKSKIHLYKYILINYLCINKILKKIRKNHNKSFLEFIEKYTTLDNYLSSYNFYKNIKKLPDELKYKINQKCPICLEDTIFPIETECAHTFCWDCLHNITKQTNLDYCPLCRTETLVDPIMIIVNTIFDCDIKYSPFNNKEFDNSKKKIEMDLISDMHIDQWSFRYNIKYPCGEVKEFPFEFKENKNKYLVIAGDISDDIEESIKFIEDVAKIYSKVIFVDGNHEHINAYPKLFRSKQISKMIKSDNVEYLPEKSFIENNTAFVGCCGWWDYNNNDINAKEKNYDYFKEWIPNFTKKDSLDFIDNVIQESVSQFKQLKQRIEELENDEKIKNIIVVTHTVPLIELCDKGQETTELNSKFEKLIKNNKKISYWFFGHTHMKWEVEKNGIKFVSSPRGRPEDFNREKYNMKSLVI